MIVSMESGLEGRNNELGRVNRHAMAIGVSMESGLEGRNNCLIWGTLLGLIGLGLNGVRPRRPEQWVS